MSKKINIIVGIMLCFILLASVRNFSRYPLGYGPVWYIGGYTLLILAFYSFYINKRAHTLTYLAPILYIIWAFWGIFRGQFEITSGFVLNQYFHGILYVLVPMCIFLFAYPDTNIRSFQILNIFNVVFSIGSFLWNYELGAYYFAFTPFIYFYLCFFPKLPTLWKFITILAIVLIVVDRTNGSGNIKILMSTCVLFVFLLPKIFRNVCLYTIPWLIYIIPIIFLFLGITGQFDIFKDSFENSPNTTVIVRNNGIEIKRHKTHIDTRTFIYEEIFSSAIVNDYIITGRTPARGYYSPYFAKDEKNAAGKIPGERFSSEVAHLNTLQWLGVIGLILISFVYLQGSWLALYRSNNKYVKCLSLEVAFLWMWGWVENENRFHMLDVMIFVILAICYSPCFRKMTNLEFEMYLKSMFAFPNEKIHEYNKYQYIKIWFQKYKNIKDQDSL